MKFARSLILTMALGTLAGVAAADTADPAIGVKGGTGSLPWNGGVTEFCSATCNLTLPSPTQPYFNNTGGIIASFIFQWDRPQGSFTLLNNPSLGFLNAQLVFPTNFNPNAPEVILNLVGFTIGTSPSCDEEEEGDDCKHPPASEFALEIDGGVGNLTVTSSETLAPVPEPGTLTLLGFGLGGAILRRLRRDKAVS